MVCWKTVYPFSFVLWRLIRCFYFVGFSIFVFLFYYVGFYSNIIALHNMNHIPLCMHTQRDKQMEESKMQKEKHSRWWANRCFFVFNLSTEISAAKIRHIDSNQYITWKIRNNFSWRKPKSVCIIAVVHYWPYSVHTLIAYLFIVTKSNAASQFWTNTSATITPINDQRCFQLKIFYWLKLILMHKRSEEKCHLTLSMETKSNDEKVLEIH